MPSKSEAQKKAMQAASQGKSTLGIPAKIGKEFAATDKKRGKSPFKLGKSQKGKSKT
jgi:hypothetical protein